MAVPSSEPFTPRDEHVQVLDESLNQFNDAPLARLRDVIPPAFVAAWAGLLALLLMVALVSSLVWSLAVIVAAAGIAAALSYFVIGGVADRTHLLDRVLAYLLVLRWSDWLTAAIGMLVGLLILWLLGGLIPVTIGIVLGAGLGAAFYFLVDKPLAASRREPLDKIETLHGSLRRSGVDEEALQQFVASYSGERWEEFYETLFGYEAKLRARASLSPTDQLRRRKPFRAWRDGILRAIDARLQADRRRQQRMEEEAAFEEPTVQAGATRDEAAEALAHKETSATAGQPADAKVLAAAKRSRQLQMLAEARSGRHKSTRQRQALEWAAGPLEFLLSGKVRFLAGALLLAACVMWMKQNSIVGQLETIGAAEASAQDKALGVLGTFVNVARGNLETRPLSIPLVGGYFNSFAPGIAGLILLVLSLFQGWKMSIFAWPAAVVALFMPGYVGYGIAAALAGIGLIFGRTAEE